MLRRIETPLSVACSRSNLMPAIMTPKVIFEQMDPADLPGALSSLPDVPRFDCTQTTVGTGYQIYLGWALRDLELAENEPAGENQDRLCVNAVMHARRAVSCLADQYLKREGILFCRNPPREAKAISEVLIARSIFTERAALCLQRAADVRNGIEHQYQPISMCETQDLVQLVHMTIEYTVNRSSPFVSPILYGEVDGGAGVGSAGVYGTFGGWRGCSFVSIIFEPRPWLGIVQPTSNFEATVRRAFFDDFTVQGYLAVLEILDDQKHFRPSGSSMSPDLWCAQFKKAALLS